jgi:hypothetical protein
MTQPWIIAKEENGRAYLHVYGHQIQHNGDTSGTLVIGSLSIKLNQPWTASDMTPQYDREGKPLSEMDANGNHTVVSAVLSTEDRLALDALGAFKNKVVF